jgi:hypothetical protein
MKKILLIAGGGYILGFVGAFIVTLMNTWDVGPAGYVFTEALILALLWPVELVKLFL